MNCFVNLRGVVLTLFAITLTYPVGFAAVLPNSDFGGSSPDPFYLNAGQSLTYLRVNESSHVVVNGGTIENSGRPRGFSRSTLRMWDEATAEIHDGVFRDVNMYGTVHVFHLEGDSRLVVHNGVFEDHSGFGDLLRLMRGAGATINGGDFYSRTNSVIGTWLTNGSSFLEINGGSFTSDSRSAINHASGLLSIHGGVFDGATSDLRLVGGAADIYAVSARLNGRNLQEGAIQESEGTLDLVFANGASESLTFERIRGGIFLRIVVPEPTTAMTLAVGLVAACHTRFRRRFLESSDATSSA